MKYLIGGRGTGISSQIVFESCSTGIPILISNNYYKTIYVSKAKELHLNNIPTFINIKNLNGYSGDILIDNGTHIITELLNELGGRCNIVSYGDTIDNQRY